ncbi:hypothetical protein [Streptomyces sparsogenes]|uniref:hypothetical protein n=1 Tax=Streptomyces sparsogenes TaxID=67365 RepID=UPI0033CB843A
MAGQISVEAALAAFRKKCSDLLDANVLLEARVSELESELEQLRNQSRPLGLGAAEQPDQVRQGDDTDFDRQDRFEQRHGSS